MQALSEDGSSGGSGQSDSCKEDSASSSDEGSDFDADAGAVGHTKRPQQGSAGVVPPVMLALSRLVPYMLCLASNAGVSRMAAWGPYVLSGHLWAQCQPGCCKMP